MRQGNGISNKCQYLHVFDNHFITKCSEFKFSDEHTFSITGYWNTLLFSQFTKI